MNRPLGPPIRREKEGPPDKWVKTDNPLIERNLKTGNLRTVDMEPPPPVLSPIDWYGIYGGMHQPADEQGDN